MSLTTGSITYPLVVVYIPPGQLQEKDRDLHILLITLVDNTVSLVVGYFNCHIDWEERDPTAEGTPLLEFANDNYLTQWVKDPTRGDNILELVLTSEDNIVKSLVVREEVGGSDHRLVLSLIHI